MRKRSGPNIDPWVTPAKIGLHDDVWPFRKPSGVYLINNFQEDCKTLLIYSYSSIYEANLHAKLCLMLLTYLKKTVLTSTGGVQSNASNMCDCK